MARTDHLNLLCWQGYDSDHVLDPIADRLGIRIEAQTLVSDAQAVRRIADRNSPRFDVLNINNAYIQKYLHPRGLVRPLDRGRFEPAFGRMLPQFRQLYRWAYSEDGAELLGICQRFGAFNFVINTKRISSTCAQDEGFSLTQDPKNRGRFGVLYYEDFNIFHICIGADLNPFVVLGETEIDDFERAARQWFDGAAIVTDDHLALNAALVDGTIDFYLSGGVYTASPARLAGRSEVVAVTPLRGPIGGRGGIAFTEITSVLEGSRAYVHAEDFLECLLEPEAAVRVAFSEGTHNPVAQMGDPRVLEACTRQQLDAIQWNTLEEEIARCADYDLVPDYATLLAKLRSAASGRVVQHQPKGVDHGTLE